MDNKFQSGFWRPLSLRQMHSIKKWNSANQLPHSLEGVVWNIIVTAWLMGWIGWLPSWVFNAVWAYPLCLVAMLLPQSYVYARTQAHSAGIVRCDWLHVLTKVPD